MALRGIIFFLLGAGFWFLAKWATAKLHRFTVFSPYFSPLFNFCSLFFLLVLVLLLLSAGFPSLLRHQTWALLRSVERALGSTNRITGVARAGVYGVCLHWPGPGEGWVTLRWDFLLSFMLLLFLSLRFPPPSVPPGYYDLSASSSHTLPVYLWVHPIWFFTSCLGKKVLRTSACMSGVCVYVFKLQSCRMHSYNEPYWD